MALEFKFPDVGEGIHEGTVVKWHVKEGDVVKEDQTLCDMETAKAIVEIPSPRAGTLLKVNGKEGDVIKVGDVLVVIGSANEVSTGGEAPSASAIDEKKAAKRAAPVKGVGVVGELPEATDEVTRLTPKKTTPASGAVASGVRQEVFVLPAVRNLAKSMGVDLATVKGTGPGGRITEQDVKISGTATMTKGPETTNVNRTKESSQESISATLVAPGGDSVAPTFGGVKKVRKYDMWGYVNHVPYKGIRKTIGDHMAKSKNTAVHVTHSDKVDVTALVEHREKEKKNLEKQGIKLTYFPFIVKAVLKGLQEFPTMNATLDDANADIIVKKYYNIGIAVDVPDGLMVPVLKRVDQKSIIDLAKEIQELAEKAKSRKIDMMDLKGASFTISNVGSIGGTVFTPIINHPEVAILGVASIKKEPAVFKDKVAVRDMMYLSVSFDHRVVDGATAARFLNTVMRYLSDPDLLLLEVK